jgi:HK97 family phage major capsid protein
MGKYIKHITSIHAIPERVMLKVIGEIDGKKFVVFAEISEELLADKDFLETYAKTLAEDMTAEILDDNQTEFEKRVLYGDGSAEPKGILKATKKKDHKNG